MEMAEFLDTLRPEMKAKEGDLTTDEYREWLRSQVAQFRKYARMDYSKKIQARYNVVADFYEAALAEIETGDKIPF